MLSQPYGFNMRPLLWFAVCYVTGSAFASAWSGYGIWLAGGGLMLLLMALAVSQRMSITLAVLCLLAYAAAAGERVWVDTQNETTLTDIVKLAEASYPPVETPVIAEGIVMSPAKVDGDLASFRMTATSITVGNETPRQLRERLQIRVRLLSQPEQQLVTDWRRGQRVQASGVLALPSEEANNGGFDYRRYLHSQGINWLLRVDGTEAIATAPGSRFSAAALLAYVDVARDWLAKGMERLYPDKQAGYMQGLVLGITDEIDPDLYREFSQLGMTHILAISGLHVTVVLLVLGGALRFLRQPRERILLLLIVAVPLYVLLSGASPSVIRAGLMAMLGLTAARMNKLKDGLHLLAASAVLMLLWNPLVIENVSFQLSYLVTAGLIIGVPMLNRVLAHGKKNKWLREAIVMNLTATLASFPLTIYYFNQFYLLSLPANLLLVSFISVLIMPAGAISLLLLHVWPLGGEWLAFLVVLGNKLTFAIMDKMNKADALRTIWASPPIWWIAAWYAALALFLHQLGKYVNIRTAIEVNDSVREMDATQPLGQASSNQGHHGGGNAISSRSLSSLGHASRGIGGILSKLVHNKVLVGLIVTGATVLLLLAYAWNPNWNDNTAEVSVLNVGQGDSILTRTASGKHILVDGSGTVKFQRSGDEWKTRRDPYEVGRKVLVPLLLKRGVKQIDLLIMTHLDTDHIGGLKAVIDTIPVRRILWNGTIKNSSETITLMRDIINKGIPVFGAEAGQTWQIDDHAAIEVLWPKPATTDTDAETGSANVRPIRLEPEQNALSVVTLLTLYERKFLLTGDIDEATEQAILQSLRQKAVAETGNESGTVQSSLDGEHRIDVLKVAHHGSRYSTGNPWLAYWRPQVAAISVGLNNRYGHPGSDTLDRLKMADTAVWRTDLNGEIDFRVTPLSELSVHVIHQ